MVAAAGSSLLRAGPATAVASCSTFGCPSRAFTSSATTRAKRNAKQREMPLRKQFLMEQYKHVLTTSQVIVFLRPSDFDVAELTRLRVDLAMIPLSKDHPTAADINASAAHNALSSSASALGRPKYMHLRAGLVQPALRSLPNVDGKSVLDFLKKEGGSLAALVIPTLDPPTLKAALKAVQKLSTSPNVRKQRREAEAAANAAGKKGKAPSSSSAASQGEEERLPVLSALVDAKHVPKGELDRIANLPSLQEILGQLVGLLEMPARSTLGVISQASGQDLARTLEGFKIGLEEQQKGPEEAAPAPAS